MMNDDQNDNNDSNCHITIYIYHVSGGGRD